MTTGTAEQKELTVKELETQVKALKIENEADMKHAAERLAAIVLQKRKREEERESRSRQHLDALNVIRSDPRYKIDLPLLEHLEKFLRRSIESAQERMDKEREQLQAIANKEWEQSLVATETQAADEGGMIPMVAAPEIIDGPANVVKTAAGPSVSFREEDAWCLVSDPSLGSKNDDLKKVKLYADNLKAKGIPPKYLLVDWSLIAKDVKLGLKADWLRTFKAKGSVVKA